MPDSYQILYRHGRGGDREDEDGHVELTTVRLDGEAGMEDGESGSEGTGPREDAKSLIAAEEEIDENGVAKDYEVALKHIGFGLFHVLLIAINGVALLSDAVEARTRISIPWSVHPFLPVMVSSHCMYL